MVAATSAGLTERAAPTARACPPEALLTVSVTARSVSTAASNNTRAISDIDCPDASDSRFHAACVNSST